MEPQHLVSRVLADVGARAALMYGSRVWGDVHQQSDVDLICLASAPTRRKQIVWVDGTAVDVFLGSDSHLERAITNRKVGNDNYILHACAEGKIVIDDGGILERISNLAKDVWRNGPAVPSLAELQFISYEMNKLKLGAEIISGKTELNPHDESLASLRCDSQFSRIALRYCRVNLLWSAPVWVSIHWTNPRYRELQIICRRYLDAHNLQDKCNMIGNFADLVNEVVSGLRNSYDLNIDGVHRRAFEGAWI
jgi:hypothetical protein